MAIDTPARVAVLGAGPIGLETALYARFLGYDVDVFERGQVAAHVRQWSHVRLFTPFGMNHSSLGRSAIEAQGTAGPLPPDDKLVTGEQWIAEYLEPLSRVDLLVDCIHTDSSVISVGKEDYLKSEMVSQEDRFDELFQILVRCADGEERWHSADIVVDTTGTFGTANDCGPGGMPSAGDSTLRHATTNSMYAVHEPTLSYRLPDICGVDRDRFANQHVLVVGGGYSAATNVTQLLQLRQEAPDTSITWVVRRARPADESVGYPITRFPNDRLASRDALAMAANRAVTEKQVTLLAGVQIERLTAPDSRTWRVEFSGEDSESRSVNAILANVGFRGDWALSEELQVQRCYASGGPMRWSALLLAQAGGDCLDNPQATDSALTTTEPNFYVLGSKSYGRWSNFLYQTGLEQIRQLFGLISDRQDLDLYRSPLSVSPG